MAKIVFSYRGVDGQGAEARGTVEALDKEDALRQLQALETQGLHDITFENVQVNGAQVAGSESSQAGSREVKGQEKARASTPTLKVWHAIVLAICIIGVARSCGTSPSKSASSSQTQSAPASTDNAASGASAFTYDNMMEHFAQVFDMELSTPVDGEARYMGTATNETTMLELIGNKNALTSAALMTGFPTDNEATLVENAAILVLFTKNAFPDWPGCGEWVIGAMERLGSGTANSEERTMGDKTIKVSLIKQLGFVTITVRRR